MTKKGQMFPQDHLKTPTSRLVRPQKTMRRPKRRAITGVPVTPKHISSSLRLRYLRREGNDRVAPQFLHTVAPSSFSAPHFEQ